MGFNVNADSTWMDSKRPEPGSALYVIVCSSPYCDGVKLSFGDSFNVTLTPEQAIELGQSLAAVGSYHQIFKARFGVEDLDAEVKRRSSDVDKVSGGDNRHGSRPKPTPEAASAQSIGGHDEEAAHQRDPVPGSPPQKIQSQDESPYSHTGPSGHCMACNGPCGVLKQRRHVDGVVDGHEYDCDGCHLSIARAPAQDECACGGIAPFHYDKCPNYRPAQIMAKLATPKKNVLMEHGEQCECTPCKKAWNYASTVGYDGDYFSETINHYLVGYSDCISCECADDCLTHKGRDCTCGRLAMRQTQQACTRCSGRGKMTLVTSTGTSVEPCPACSCKESSK